LTYLSSYVETQKECKQIETTAGVQYRILLRVINAVDK